MKAWQKSITGMAYGLLQWIGLDTAYEELLKYMNDNEITHKFDNAIVKLSTDMTNKLKALSNDYGRKVDMVNAGYSEMNLNELIDKLQSLQTTGSSVAMKGERRKALRNAKDKVKKEQDRLEGVRKDIDSKTRALNSQYYDQQSALQNDYATELNRMSIQSSARYGLQDMSKLEPTTDSFK